MYVVIDISLIANAKAFKERQKMVESEYDKST